MILLPRYGGDCYAAATRRTTWRRHHQHVSLLPVGSISSSFSYARTTKRGSTATAGGVVLLQTTAPSAVTTTGRGAAASSTTDTLDRNIERLRTALCKPSKTLAVAYEIVVATSKDGGVDDDPILSWSSIDVDARSMQLRKIGAAALFVNDLQVAQQLAKEQESARNSFPGPLPVVYCPCRLGHDDDLLASSREAVDAGIAAVAVAVPVNDNKYMDLWKDSQQYVPVVHVIETVEDATKLVEAWGGSDTTHQRPMFVMIPLCSGDSSSSNADMGEDPSITNFIAIRNILPPDAVVIASVQAMHADNQEVQSIRKAMTASPSQRRPVLNAVLVRNAVVGDNEDVEYAEFVKSGLTAKRSSTFNVSGLTGSTNGHFGGVASSVPKTWLRTQR